MKKINEKDIQLLEKLLENTELAKEPQMESLQKLAPGLVGYSKYTGDIKPVHVDFYSRYNKELNKELSRVLDIDDLNPLTVHTVNYEVGGEVLEHIDANSFNTFVIMLDDNYEGGDFYIEDELIEFHKRGEVAQYVGWQKRHRVSPVTKGTRKVLVMWYGANHTKTII